MWTEGQDYLNIFKDSTGKPTRNLASCGAVSQRTAPLTPSVIR